jgi:hypothetical protein
MEENIKGVGFKIKCLVKAFIHGVMEKDILVNILMG